MILRTVVLISALMAGVAFQAKAQKCGANAASTISTDRPQITNSSIVVPCGSLQFENGFEQDGTAGHQGFDLSETSVRFSVTNKTELRFAVPDYFKNYDTGSDSRTEPAIRSSDSSSSWGLCMGSMSR